jgi:FtsP/CotA-like multicopper oxidase with cupredoxin domain
MDGVPMITQCPILPFSGFRYKIHPDNAGTYFYHAHSGIFATVFLLFILSPDFLNII